MQAHFKPQFASCLLVSLWDSHVTKSKVTGQERICRLEWKELQRHTAKRLDVRRSEKSGPIMHPVHSIHRKASRNQSMTLAFFPSLLWALPQSQSPFSLTLPLLQPTPTLGFLFIPNPKLFPTEICPLVQHCAV